MNYKQTLDFLYQAVPMYHLMGSAAYDGKLTKTKQFLSALGHPEKNTRFIHVAGTNGKGSVTHNFRHQWKRFCNAQFGIYLSRIRI